MAYYLDTNNFTTATAVWTNSILTTKAPDGYYSFGGDYRQQIDGFLTDLISCTDCPDCILICDQTWTNKNLDVATYRDGTPIPQVTDPTQWANLTTGAWCYYDNDPANGVIYGKLYNWYAVNDPRGLAPTGYHVPTDAEWTILTTCLGGETIAGGKMKSTGILLWASPNTDATNSSGFTGLPGGSRNMFGTFENIGFYDSFWSSTEQDSFNAWDRFLSYNNDNAGRGYINKKIGCSIRLIKDE